MSLPSTQEILQHVSRIAECEAEVAQLQTYIALETEELQACRDQLLAYHLTVKIGHQD